MAVWVGAGEATVVAVGWGAGVGVGEGAGVGARLGDAIDKVAANTVGVGVGGSGVGVGGTGVGVDVGVNAVAGSCVGVGSVPPPPQDIARGIKINGAKRKSQAFNRFTLSRAWASNACSLLGVEVADGVGYVGHLVIGELGVHREHEIPLEEPLSPGEIEPSQPKGLEMVHAPAAPLDEHLDA